MGGGSTTLNGFARDLGGAGPGTLTGDGTLTLGPSLIVNAKRTARSKAARQPAAGAIDDNQGQVNVTGELSIESHEFSNEGVISNDGAMDINGIYLANTYFANSGTIISESTLTIVGEYGFYNTGVISIDFGLAEIIGEDYLHGNVIPPFSTTRTSFR